MKNDAFLFFPQHRKCYCTLFLACRSSYFFLTAFLFPGVWSAWLNSWLVMQYAICLACTPITWNVLMIGLCEASRVHHAWSQLMQHCLQVMRPTSVSKPTQATHGWKSSHVAGLVLVVAVVVVATSVLSTSKPRLTKVEVNLEP